MPDTVEISFPLAGIDQSDNFCTQNPRQMPDGDYGHTCYLGQNIRSYDSEGARRRGGSRAGLAKVVADPIVADWIVQDLATLAGTGYADVTPGGAGFTWDVIAMDWEDITTNWESL